MRLLMASLNPGTASTAASADLSERVADALKPYLDRDDFPGISVAVVTDGQVALAQGYGLANVATKAPVGGDTRFDIGSVTKTFTAIGVMLLYQESQGTSQPINLDAPIGQYLHNTASFRLPPKWSHVTVRELLDMSSGIKEVSTAMPWQTQIRSIANAPLLFHPGTKTSYSDPNFYLLGELIEQRTGEKYGTFIQNQILAPLGMSETQLLGQSPVVANQAVGYAAPTRRGWLKAPVQNGPALYAAAGIVSTATDMATYMTALLSDRILDPATYQLMWAAMPSPGYGNAPASNLRSLGWDMAIDTSTGVTEVSKNGLVPGYSSVLVLYPSTDSGVFISFNTSHEGDGPNGVTAMQVATSVYDATQ